MIMHGLVRLTFQKTQLRFLLQHADGCRHCPRATQSHYCVSQQGASTIGQVKQVPSTGESVGGRVGEVGSSHMWPAARAAASRRKGAVAAAVAWCIRLWIK